MFSLAVKATTSQEYGRSALNYRVLLDRFDRRLDDLDVSLLLPPYMFVFGLVKSELVCFQGRRETLCRQFERSWDKCHHRFR